MKMLQTMLANAMHACIYEDVICNMKEPPLVSSELQDLLVEGMASIHQSMMPKLEQKEIILQGVLQNDCYYMNTGITREKIAAAVGSQDVLSEAVQALQREIAEAFKHIYGIEAEWLSSLHIKYTLTPQGMQNILRLSAERISDMTHQTASG